MEYRIEEAGPLTYRLSMDILKEELEPRVLEELKKARKRVTIPGFRKGKAPLDLVKIRYGEQIEQDVLLDVAEEKARDIVRNEKYDVFGGFELVEQQKLPEGHIHVVLEFQVMPEITIKKVDGLKVVKEVRRVTDDDVEAVIENLRKEQAVYRKKEDGAEEGDFVVADLQELDVSGAPLIGKKFENRQLRLGDGPFGDQLLQQLKGVKPGDERRITIQYQEEGKGRPQENQGYYQVRVKDVISETLPNVDDDFARSLGDYKDLNELREKIRERLQAQFDRQSEERLRWAIQQEFVKSNPLELPSKLVEWFTRRYYEEYAKDLSPKPSYEEFKEQHQAEIIQELKWIHLRDKLVEEEGIQVTDEELEAEIEKIAQHTRQVKPEEVKRYYQNPKNRENLRRDLLHEKVLKRLLEKAKIKEMDVTDQVAKRIETV